MARVLIVDDVAELRDLWTMLLREDAYEVLATADLASALTAAARQAPDLVLIDLSLPEDLRGGLIRYLRASLDRAPHIVALASSAREAKAARAAGADAVLVRPVDISAVVTATRSLLGSPVTAPGARGQRMDLLSPETAPGSYAGDR